jgi:hypothetical protein
VGFVVDKVFFCVPLSISFHRGFPGSFITWGTKNRPVGGRSSETSYHPIDMNNNNNNNNNLDSTKSLGT